MFLGLHDYRVCVGQRVSPVGAVVQAVMEGLAEDRVLVVDPPGGLQDRVQQTVPGRAVPQGVQPAVQPGGQLQGPVDDGRLLFKLCTRTKEKIRTVCLCNNSVVLTVFTSKGTHIL